MSPDGFMAIDGGNSRLKATLLGVREEPEVRIFAPDDTEGLLAEVERSGVRRAAMACVGHVDSRLAESLRMALPDRFLLITSSTRLPIGIAYPHPETLGLDRKATSVAAAAEYPGECCLVLDSGSALTCDLVAGGAFAGGSISPGLRMRLRALHEFTAKLPEVEICPDCGLPAAFATDTPGAIASGVARGLVYEVAGDIMAAAMQSGSLDRVILTGGDAPFILKAVGELCADEFYGAKLRDIKITYDPHLLAKGLRAIYTYHENEL